MIPLRDPAVMRTNPPTRSRRARQPGAQDTSTATGPPGGDAAEATPGGEFESLPRRPWTCRWGRRVLAPQSVTQPEVGWACQHPAGRALGDKRLTLPCPRCPVWDPPDTAVLAALAVLPREERWDVAAFVRVRHYERGEAVVNEGERSDFVPLVARGRVKVSRTAAAGHEILLTEAGPGDPVGVLTGLDDGASLVSVRAVEPATCLLVLRRLLVPLVERYPKFAQDVLVGVGRLRAALMTRAPELMGGRVETRFARLFLRLAHSMGRPEGRGVRIAMPLSRRELAGLTGTTIETCIRLMRRWHRQRVVRTDARGFLVRDVARLKKLA